jgi:hypothetical protein
VVKLADFGVSRRVESGDLAELNKLAQSLASDKQARVAVKSKVQGTNLQTMVCAQRHVFVEVWLFRLMFSMNADWLAVLDGS